MRFTLQVRRQSACPAMSQLTVSDSITQVQSRFAETLFAETLTLTLTLNPNTNFGESGRHQ